jgi:SOS-response transcriptional repressor LexA
MDTPTPPGAAADLPAQPLHFVPRAAREQPGCASHEPFALQVLGDDMRPEFEPGDVVIIEPEGVVQDGSFVLARLHGDWALRLLARDGDHWRLRTLRAADAGEPVADLGCVRGVVIQRSKPGRRRLAKRYVE